MSMPDRPVLAPSGAPARGDAAAAIGPRRPGENLDRGRSVTCVDTNDTNHPARLTERVVIYESPGVVQLLRNRAERDGCSTGAVVRGFVRRGLVGDREPEARR